MSKVYVLVDERLMAAKNPKRSRHPRHFVVAAYSSMKKAQEAADGYLEALSFAPQGQGWKQGKLKGEITKTESSGKKSDKYGSLHATYRDDEAVLGHLRILTLTVNQPPEDEIDYMTAETFGAEKLTKKERAALPDSDFALPKERKYPIPDLAHGRLALTYTQWHKPEDDDEVAAAVLKKYPSLKGWWKEHKKSENFYGAEEYKGTTASGHMVEYDDGSFYMEFAEPIQGYDSVGGSWYGGDNESPDDIDLQVYHANEDYDNFEISISDVEYYGVSQNKRNRWRLDNDSRGNGPDIFVDMSDELVEAIEEGLNWMLGDFEDYNAETFNADEVAYAVMWEGKEDDNDGLIYGIEYMDGEEVSDVEWFATAQDRDAELKSYIEEFGEDFGAESPYGEGKQKKAKKVIETAMKEYDEYVADKEAYDDDDIISFEEWFDWHLGDDELEGDEETLEYLKTLPPYNSPDSNNWIWKIYHGAEEFGAQTEAKRALKLLRRKSSKQRTQNRKQARKMKSGRYDSDKRAESLSNNILPVFGLAAIGGILYSIFLNRKRE